MSHHSIKYTNTVQNLENQLNQLSIEIEDILILAEKSIKICLECMIELRTQVIQKGFKNHQDEIHFFKEIKPRCISHLIYNNTVYKIETNYPNGDVKSKRKYLQMELSKLKSYFYDNLDFYRYYRTGSNYLDHKYFVRGKRDLRLNLDAHTYETDPDFSTSHDFKISTILANDLLQVYLENEITKLAFRTSTRNTEFIPRNIIHWTGSKVSLIELMYALNHSGVFNHGQADIKAIATYFEKVFDIDLGNYYRTFLELKIRQDRTKFLDTLHENLIRKMEDDEK